jgi:plastocyanin
VSSARLAAVQTALQLAPVLAAEKSHVPFYVAGGVLVVWALVISMLVGMRKASFPSDDTQQRAVMAVTVLLVAATLVTAVVTSGPPEKTEEAGAAGLASPNNGETVPAPATTPGQETKTTGENQPTATTGTPAPPSSPAGKATKLTQAADPGGQLAFEKQELTAKAGTVTIEFANASPVEHNLTIEENKKVLGATPTFVSGKRTLTVKLSPGTYTFFCSVPGHREAGMEGKLKVVP